MNTIDEFFEIYKKHVDYVSELEQNYIQQGIQFGKEQYKMWYSATTFLSYAIKMLMMNAGTIQIPPEYTIELEKLVSSRGTEIYRPVFASRLRYE